MNQHMFYLEPQAYTEASFAFQCPQRAAHATCCGRGSTHAHGRSPYTPVDLFLHVRSVTAAIVGQEQPPIVQPVGIDLNVAAVHDEDKHGQGLSGHLWGRAHIRIPMMVVHRLAVYSCPECGQRLQAADTDRAYVALWLAGTAACMLGRVSCGDFIRDLVH